MNTSRVCEDSRICDIGTQGQSVGFKLLTLFPTLTGLWIREGTMTDTAYIEERPTWPALVHGWKRKCPSCGSGPMLKGYLSVRKSCRVCKEEFHHHRADDGPAYVTILLVGHLMAILMHVTFVIYRPEPLTMATVFTVGCVGLSLYLLPRLKGAIVAFQWARGMHGFDPSSQMTKGQNADNGQQTSG
jgi:uncharacterized protein (DUF983 family)